MKQFDGWLTLALSLLSLLLTILSFFFPHPLLLLAAAVCWGIGFVRFVRLGRLARGKQRRLYGAAFFILCTALITCLILSVFLLFFRG